MQAIQDYFVSMALASLFSEDRRKFPFKLAFMAISSQFFIAFLFKIGITKGYLVYINSL